MQVNWSWIILIIAGCFEAGFAFCLGKMKEAAGTTAWWLWGAGFIICLVISMVLLAKATHVLPISTAYPVWTGIGAVLTVILGILVFHEPASFARIFFICTPVLKRGTWEKTSMVFWKRKTGRIILN